MTLAEARTLVERAFPGENVQLISQGGACIVRHPKDGDIGRAFGWLPALQQACKPILAAADKARLLAREKQAEDFTLFIEFMREKLDGEFTTWKEARAARATPPSGDAPGTAADPVKLVSLVSE